MGGMGFRDIMDFNQALLAKQAWKVVNEPDTLLSRLYKGRYFGNKNFLDCGKGYRPSYAWRSIMFGRKLLLRGLIVSVGDGKGTNVWSSKWIMDVHPRPPLMRQRTVNIMLKVSDLITTAGSWDIAQIHHLFTPQDASQILKMQVGHGEDKAIWSYTDNGAYTVKSGYWFLSNNPLLPLPPKPQIEQDRIGLKQRIWKLNTLPRIKTFLWRVMSGALAVANRLQTRGIQVDSICKICNGSVETISHVLFECPTAQLILDLAKIPFPSTGFGNSLENNMQYMLNLMENASIAEDVRAPIPWLLWNVWKNRNSILYSASQEAVEKVVERILEEAKTWRQVNQQSTLTQGRGNKRVENKDRWQKPRRGILKCNLNANWRNSHLCCGFAWLVRDDEGAVRFHARDAGCSLHNRITAELKCITWAMQSLADIHLEEVIFAFDLQPAFQAISKPHEWPRYRFWLHRIDQLKKKFRICEFELEHISSNAVTRAISKSVTRDGRLQSYLSLGGPAWLHDQIQGEAR